MGDKWVVAIAVGRDPWSWRRARDRLSHRGVHWENKSLQQLAWKVRGAGFHEFLRASGLKAWCSEGQWALLKESLEGTTQFLEKRQANDLCTYSVETI